jgi:malate dehydrogenase (oxaloacetate-decarboxylating)(NADP+)
MTINKRGMELLRDPSLNKSTAFTEAEKQALGIVGLVSDVTETEDLQLSRVMMQLGYKVTDLDRYIYLINLLDHNETLFYRTVMSDPARFLPIVYDPTIDEACLKFGHIYRQPRGMFLSMTRRGKVKEVLKNWPQKDVRFICVDRWRPDPRPRRSGNEWDGDPHRKAAAVHRLRWSASAIPAAHVS